MGCTIKGQGEEGAKGQEKMLLRPLARFPLLTNEGQAHQYCPALQQGKVDYNSTSSPGLLG